jgi:hypothetical protein
MDSHSWVLWVGIVAIGLHVMEEYAQGWLAWANQQVGPRFGEERVVETQTIVLEPDPEDDDTTILDREDENPPRPT